MNIELHIDELILHGFAATDRDAIGEAVRGELARLLTEGELQGVGERGYINAGTFNAHHGDRAESLGLQIARVVHGGISSPVENMAARTWEGK